MLKRVLICFCLFSQNFVLRFEIDEFAMNTFINSIEHVNTISEIQNILKS